VYKDKKIKYWKEEIWHYSCYTLWTWLTTPSSAWWHIALIAIHLSQYWISATAVQMNTAKTELLWVRYDTIVEFNVDSKADYTAKSSTRSQKLKQNSAGTKHNVSLLGCHVPTLYLGSDTATPRQPCSCSASYHFVGLSFDQHVSKVCAASFYRLCQFHRIRKSLDDESAATLVHTFMTSSVDCCNAVYSMSAQTITNRMQRVMNAAAWVVSDSG